MSNPHDYIRQHPPSRIMLANHSVHSGGVKSANKYLNNGKPQVVQTAIPRFGRGFDATASNFHENTANYTQTTQAIQGGNSYNKPQKPKENFHQYAEHLNKPVTNHILAHRQVYGGV